MTTPNPVLSLQGGRPGTSSLGLLLADGPATNYDSQANTTGVASQDIDYYKRVLGSIMEQQNVDRNSTAVGVLGGAVVSPAARAGNSTALLPASDGTAVDYGAEKL